MSTRVWIERAVAQRPMQAEVARRGMLVLVARFLGARA